MLAYLHRGVLTVLVSMIFLPATVRAQVNAVPDGSHSLKVDSIDFKGLDFVRLNGTIHLKQGKYVLESKDGKVYQLNCKGTDCGRYLDKTVKVNGILLQGYDNKKYGTQNLPISQIDPKDVINIITSIGIEPDN